MPTSPVSPELWKRYRETGCSAARECIIELNLPLVRTVAGQIYKRHGSLVDFEDLVSSGCVGLIAAVDKFDPTHGATFSTFAVPHIRGAILDDLRRRDASTRVSRRRRRELIEAERAVLKRKKEPASSTEVAAELGIDTATLHRWRARANRRELSLDRPLYNEPGAATLAEVIEVSARGTVEDGLIKAEAWQRLARLIPRLPERKRLVLHLYYFEGLPQSQIGEILGITESRVSQIRTGTIAALREQMEPGAPAAGAGAQAIAAA